MEAFIIEATRSTIGSLLENLAVRIDHAQFKTGFPDWKRNNELPAFNRLYFLTGGEGYVEIDGKRYFPKPGQLFILPAGTRQTTETSEDHPFERYFCHFHAMIGEWSLLHAAGRAFIATPSEPERVRGLFEQLIRHYKAKEPFSPLFMQAALLEMLALCLEGSDGVTYVQAFLRAQERHKLTRVLDYIATHLSESLEIERLAELVHFHPNYFISYFRKHTGLPPIHYIQLKRMEEAKRLLSFTTLSISDIADRVGLELAHFSKKFKAYSGLSPSAYRGATR
ncbi:AraC family transcriptional regulator [Paenibacillus koleovorans]|uniref:AraC family transcriptional regulator n=1 Tax=Paenibacillus koleovorans TaxID=121608 RepID=UPI001FEC14BF|nr:AraC family transcriptional regulator [Paenibacillus koleovorans]